MRKKTRYSDKHIAIYVPSLGGGGAERVMVTLGNAFADRGFKVDLVLATAEGAYLNEVSNTIRIIDLKSSRVLLSLPKLMLYLIRQRPGSMLTALNHANLIGIIARLITHAPTRLVISERNTLNIDSMQTPKLRESIVYTLMKSLYPKADSIIAVSDGVGEALSTFIKIENSKIVTVYNPHDIEAIQRKSKEPVEHIWFESENIPVILGIGRLTRQKDFQTLIRAFAKVRKDRRVRLMILGSGDMRNELLELADSSGLGEDDFCLRGFVDNPFAYLAKCSVFVLSSRWEGLPNVLIQALACGAQVIATNCPSGPSEILENGKWGSLVPVGDIDALAQAISDSFQPSYRRDVVKRAMDFGVAPAVAGYLAELMPETTI